MERAQRWLLEVCELNSELKGHMLLPALDAQVTWAGFCHVFQNPC